MSIRRASARTSINGSMSAAAAATPNMVTIAPATATTVAGGGAIGASGLTISNVAITDSTFANVLSGDTAIASGGGYVRITGTGFATGANVLFNDSLIANTFVNSTQINANIPAIAAGTYSFYIFNSDGSGAAYSSGISTSGFPTITVTSYNIDANLAFSGTQIVAEGDAPLTFSIKPGSSNLGNFTCNSAGFLSGNVIAGTYTVTILVDDSQAQTFQSDLTIIATDPIVADPYYNLTTLHLSGEPPADAWISDASTNGFPLTVNGDTRPAAFSPFTETDLTTGSAYFDGTGDYLTVPDDTALDAFTDFTIEFWVYFNSVSGSQVVLDKGWNGSAIAPYLIFLTSGSLVAYASSGGAWNILAGSSFGTMTTGQWYHIALSRSDTSIRLFTNGSLVTTVTNGTTILNGASALGIGGGPAAGANPLNGYLSNVRIVKGTAVYTEAFTPPTSPLTAIENTSLLTLQSRIGENNNRFVDNSGLSNLITRAGNATQGTFSPFSQAGWSNYFDGTGDYLSLTGSSPIQFGDGDFTVECWLYTSSANAGTFYGDRNGANFTGMVFNIGSSKVRLLMSTGSTWNLNTYSTPTGSDITLNAWNHIAVCRSGTSVNVYINGSLSYTRTFSGTLAQSSTAGAVRIGSEAGDTGSFTGYISNFRMVKGTAVYTDTFTPPTSSLTAIENTSLLTCQSNGFVDNGPSNFTLTKSGDVSVQAFSPFNPTSQWSANTVGGSMYFDGSGDYLDVADVDTAFGSSSDFTIDFWIYPTIINSATKAIFDPRTSDASAHPLVWINTNNQLYYFTTNAARITGTTALVANRWYHVALVRNSGTTTLYLDGGVQGTPWADTVDYVSTTKFRIAQRYTSTAFNYGGYLSDLRVIKGTALYTSAFTPPTAPTTPIAGTTMLLNGTSGGIIDYTGRNYEIETVNDVKVSRNIVKYGRHSIYFDGVGDRLDVTPSPNAGIFNQLTSSSRRSTIEMWIYPVSLTNGGVRSTILGSWAGSAGWTYDINPSGNIFVATNGAGPTITLSSPLTAGTWQHLAFVNDATNLKVYLNGTNVGSVAYQAPSSYIGPLVIGIRSDNLIPFNGYIEDLRITLDYARYTANFDPPGEAFKLR